VTLVEYGDYECPYCGAAYPIVKEVQSRMDDRLRFVFRNFPITTSHPHAEQAAEAAEAAAAQGSFWEMHDVLYENQKRLGDRDLRAYAERVGLDLESFDQEMAEHVHAPRRSRGLHERRAQRGERDADVLRQRDEARRLVRPRHLARGIGASRRG
jgi:predicted DsbA family dithiol-disulfide isomerase